MSEPETPSVRFSSDRPIESSTQDLLGRASFAKAIADALVGWTDRESLIITLSGIWGSGKSSLKNMVLEYLGTFEKDRRPDVLSFSPWQWSSSHLLVDGFFREMAVALGLTDRVGKRERLAVVFRSYAAIFKAGAFFSKSAASLAKNLLLVFIVLTVLGMIVPRDSGRAVLLILGALSALAAGVFQFGGEAAEHLANVFASRAEADKRSVTEIKRELSRLLSTRPKPLLVIIDDIDRLAALEIQQLFQLIKAHADFPNIVYFLILQQDLVGKALNELAPGGDGPAFLEKIVQVPFALPPIERSRLDKVLFVGLNDAFDAESEKRFDNNRWSTIYLGAIRSFFKTLRDVRRFLNTLAFHISVFRGSGAQEVDPVDLIAIEALRVFEPAVHARIAVSKDLLTGDAPMSGHHGTNDRERTGAALSEIVGLAREEHRAAVRFLLKQLFPSVGWAFDGYHVRADQESFRARRVGHEDVFDRYFLLATPENDLSQSEVERLVAQAGNHDGLVEALSEFKRRGLLTVALDRLDAYKQEIPIERSVSLAAALYDVGEDIGEEFTGFFGMSAATYINRIVLWNLRQEPDVTRRADLLEQAIRQSKGLLLPVRQVSLEDQAHRESKQPEARLLDEIGLQRLKALCVERIVSASVDGSLSRTPRLDNLLYRWRDWAGIEGPQAFTKELASTATGAVQLLAGFVGVMTSQGLGERTVRQTHFIRLKDVEIFIPAAEVEKQIRDLKAAELSEEGGRAVRAFHAALARRARGEPDEPE